MEEHELRQAWLETVVRVVRRTRHDLNNLLMVVSGCLEIALAKVDTDPARARQMLKRAQEGAAAMEAYAAKLPTLAGQPAKAPAALPFHEELGAVAAELGTTLPDGVTLEVETAEDTGLADLGLDRLQTVVTALVQNAVEALPDGGRIFVSSRNVAVGPHPQRSDLRPGLYAVLEVRDEGPGMDAEVRERLFEPFFSTKKGEERGLGLAVVYGIARQAGGAVWVESEAGKGTTVQIHVPFTEASTPPPPRGGTRAKGRRRSRPEGNGAHTVLVVDDDATVREIVRDVLADAGYAVLVAAAGPEALSLARAHEGPIDLLLTDVIMPGMDGAQVAQRFREIRPRSHVLFMSGYADEVLRSIGAGALSPFLPKPFPPETLRRKLLEVLGAA